MIYCPVASQLSMIYCPVASHVTKTWNCIE